MNLGALDLGGLFDYINYITNRDKLGEPVTPHNYQVMLNVVGPKYYREEFDKLLPAIDKEGEETILKLFNASPLYRFLSVASLLVEQGCAQLPTTLGYTLNGTSLVGTTWRFTEFVSVEEADRRKYNILTPDLSEKPIFSQTPAGYQFIPTTITSAKINFLRKVVSPYFDYCIGSADDNIYYMPVGSSVTTGGDLIDASSNVIVSGVTHLGNPTLPYTSLSVELDWDEDDKSKLADMIIEMATIRSREFNVTAAVGQTSEQ